MNVNSFYAIEKIMIREFLHLEFFILFFNQPFDDKKFVNGFKNFFSFILSVDPISYLQNGI